MLVCLGMVTWAAVDLVYNWNGACPRYFRCACAISGCVVWLCAFIVEIVGLVLITQEPQTSSQVMQLPVTQLAPVQYQQVQPSQIIQPMQAAQPAQPVEPQ